MTLMNEVLTVLVYSVYVSSAFVYMIERTPLNSSVHMHQCALVPSACVAS